MPLFVFCRYEGAEVGRYRAEPAGWMTFRSNRGTALCNSEGRAPRSSVVDSFGVEDIGGGGSDDDDGNNSDTDGDGSHDNGRDQDADGLGNDGGGLAPYITRRALSLWQHTVLARSLTHSRAPHCTSSHRTTSNRAVR